MKSANRLFAGVLFFLASLLFLLLVAAPKVSAFELPSNNLPLVTNHTAGDDQFLIVSHSGPGNGLDARFSRYIAVFDSPTGNSINFVHAEPCMQRIDSNSPATTTFSISRSGYDEANSRFRTVGGGLRSQTLVDESFGRCDSPLDITLPVPELTEATNEGYEGRYVAIISVEIANGSPGGLNAFKISSTTNNARIGFLGNPQSTYPFVLQARGQRNDTRFLSDSSIVFSLPCEVRSVTASEARIRWQDADWGTFAQGTNPGFATRLVRYSADGTGRQVIVERTGAQLGGNGEVRDFGTGYVLEAGFFYVWEWDEVRSTNGLELFIPFSSTNDPNDCLSGAEGVDPVVPLDLSASCSINSQIELIDRTAVASITITNDGDATFTIPDSRPIFNVTGGSANPNSGTGQGGVRTLASGESTTFNSGPIQLSDLTAYTVSWPEFAVTGVPLSDPATLNICEEQSTVTVTRQPYFKVFNGDVSVGGYFGIGDGADACSAGNTILPTNNHVGQVTGSGEVYAYTRESGSSIRGASVQFGLQALGDVENFYSASQSFDPSPQTGLTFANVPSLGFGGNFGSNGIRCISNYWRGADQAPVHSADDIDLADLSDDQQLRRDGGSGTPLYISQSAGGDSSLTTTIYNEGSTVITSDIINNEGTFTSRASVGSIYIVTKGDIFIRPEVQRIDAVLIALPADDDPANTEYFPRGRVFTCREATTAVIDNPALAEADRDRFPGGDACSNPLEINGAVVARELRLGRTTGDINSSIAREQPTITSGGAADDEGVLTVEVRAWSALGTDQELEIINGSSLNLLTGERLGEFTLTPTPTTFTFETTNAVSNIIIRQLEDGIRGTNFGGRGGDDGDALIEYVKVGEGPDSTIFTASNPDRVNKADVDLVRLASGSLPLCALLQSDFRPNDPPIYHGDAVLYCDGGSFSYNFGSAITPTPQVSNNDNIAEIINLSPEYFVGRPAQPIISSDVYTSDSILALPPTL